MVFIPGAVNVFNVICVRSSRPHSGEPYDAARWTVSHFRYFMKISAAEPIIAVIALYFVGHWNDFFTSVYIRN